jgi:arabinogalactan endo-1,4-beta-galactosidase
MARRIGATWIGNRLDKPGPSEEIFSLPDFLPGSLLVCAAMVVCAAASGCAGSAPSTAGTGGAGRTATGGVIGSEGTGAAGGGIDGRTPGAPGGGAGIKGTGGNASVASGGGGATSIGGSAGVGTGAGGRAPLAASFFIGADITFVQRDELGGATYSDGTRKEILQLLKDHGFNYVRLRTFVDPRAADGYDRVAGYGDLAHTIAFGKRIKSAGMGFLLDFHYSDNWADPGKQCVPVAWQGATTIAALATALADYTRDAITQLIAAGARPDMVQIGNEITPGMLIHRCDAAGQPIGNNPITGSISNWNNLGALLKAGAQAIRDIDPGIQIMIHIDRGGTFTTSRDYIRNALTQGVPFDVFGESCYVLYQGPPAGWMSTFTQLAAMFPTLKFVAAEYGPEQRAVNDILFNLPNQSGIGTFNWEPTHTTAGNAGHTLFTTSGNAFTATPDLALYDLMRPAYASRL